jgi:hypothetical protein
MSRRIHVFQFGVHQPERVVQLIQGIERSRVGRAHLGEIYFEFSTSGRTHQDGRTGGIRVCGVENWSPGRYAAGGDDSGDDETT